MLLDDADGGTPQRMLWLSATDPDAPDEQPDAKPGRLMLAPMEWPPGGWGNERHVMKVCKVATGEIDADRLARLRGQGDGLDGHAMLARLKVAAALSVLSSDTPTEVTEDLFIA